MSNSPLQLHLSLKGRPMKDFTFIQESVRIGRDPQAEVCIDNPGISRTQARILRQPDGWILEDCQSANGTWLNGRQIQRERLSDRDEISVGKFTLQVSLAAAGLLPFPGGGRPRPEYAGIDQTTVLTQGQLAAVLDLARTAEAPLLEPMRAYEEETMPEVSPWRRRFVLCAMFLVAMAMGAFLAMMFLR